MPEYLCFFLRMNLLYKVLVRVLRTESGGFTALLRTGSMVVFVPASHLLVKCLYCWWNWLKTCFHWNILLAREGIGIGMWSPPTSNPWRAPKCTDRNWGELSSQIAPQVKEALWGEAVFSVLAWQWELSSTLVGVTDFQNLPKPYWARASSMFNRCCCVLGGLENWYRKVHWIESWETRIWLHLCGSLLQVLTHILSACRPQFPYL